MNRGKESIKLLKIENKKGYFITEDNGYDSVLDIQKEDILNLSLLIINEEEVEIEEYNEENLIIHDVEKIIYKELYLQLKDLLTDKEKILNQINNKYDDIVQEYNLET